jgi:hypothetical protein
MADLRFEIVEQAENPVDVGILFVETVKRAGEPRRVTRIVTLVERLTARKG